MRVRSASFDEYMQTRKWHQHNQNNTDKYAERVTTRRAKEKNR